MSSAGVAVSQIRPDESVISPFYFHNTLDLRSGESIMINLSVEGDVSPMRVSGSDSIQSVKLRIQTCKGFVVKNQKLVCDGRELSRNGSLVRDYGVSDGNVLHLVLRLSDLQVIKVKTVCGKELVFHAERSRDMSYVKRQIAKRGKGLVDIDDQELICDGERLEDQQRIIDICKRNDAVIHLLVRKSAKIRAKPIEKNFELSIDAPQLNIRGQDGVVDARSVLDGVLRNPPGRDFLLEPIIVNPNVEVPSAVWDLINMTFDGLDNGNYPVRSTEGSGGAYFMLDSAGQEYVSVFKPIDEEPKAVNNPQGLPSTPDGEGLKRGTRVGEGAFREAAAYLLDHPISGPRAISGEMVGFAGVPPTGLVKILHRGFNHPKGITVKVGSLQKFVKNYGSCEDIGPNSFPVEEVHKISVLDIRLANADRHAGNILLSKDGETGETVLIPIDHGYCLPESFEDCTFDWLYWPQARQPYSPDTIEYIKSLDAEEDIALLKSYGWDLPPESACIFRISTMLLKKGVEKGLTPYAIGSIMCRETLNKESVIEEIMQETIDAVLPGTSENVFLETVSQIMDLRLDEIAANECRW
ncbi:Phosphatidylinositol 4-kinase gamma 4 [Ancistrocladus abbreviatus]